MRNTFRHADTMIAVESRPATISFEEILEATEVVADQYESMTPWEHCDGFEHTATPERRFRDEADAREMQGSVYCDGHRERLVIELPKEEDYGIYQHMRERGASRQVAREAVAAERRRTLAQLVEWYGNGWEWFGVKCDFEVLGEQFDASLWGIDDPDYAEREVKEEIALEVAHQLEKAGYTVAGKPDRQAAYLRHRREVKQGQLTRNLAAQNWTA
jgi:protein-tyrosine-phosphatase